MFFILFSQCLFLALSNQHATSMHQIIMYFVSGSITFTHPISWRYVFRTDVLNIIYIYWFRLNICSVNFLILTWIQRDIVIHVQYSLYEIPPYACRYLVKYNLLYRFGNLVRQLFFIRPVRANGKPWKTQETLSEICESAL